MYIYFLFSILIRLPLSMFIWIQQLQFKVMATIHVTQQQKQILRFFQDLEKDLVYYPVNANVPPQSQLASKNSNKSIDSQQLQVMPKQDKRQSQCIQQMSPTFLNPHQLLHLANPNPKQISPQHSKLLTKLLSYKQKSSQIHTVSVLLHQYDTNFKHLQKQRLELLKQLQNLHSSTSQLIYKQKKYIDLSNTMKQALDYYEVLDKFQFNWPCQVAAREMFQDQLQSLLSQLTDGIQFFTLNTNYTNSKKYLNGLIAAKTKVTSFTKSFFIKLLNKQYGFTLKYLKNIQLQKTIQNLYPKSKPKFLLQFISFYPQFQKEIKVILLGAKQSSNQSQSSQLMRKQTEIQQFLLNESSLSLITYLQKNIPDVYEEVILKFISFYRTSFHENYYKKLIQSIEKQKQKYQKFQQYFRQIFIQVIFILTCQAGYLQYCFRSSTELAKQYTKGTLSKISQFYSGLLIKLARQPGKNKDPFKICNELSYILEQSDKFLRNYSSKQYQTYAVGAIIHYVQQFGIEILKSIFQKTSTKIKAELQTVCQNMLPKYKQNNQKSKLTQQIKQFVELIPNLQYCPTYAEKYLITTLDTIIKSIKQVSTRFQSRLESYAWNLEIFALIEGSLDKLPYTLVKKEMKINVGETTRMIQRVRNVNRTQNLMKYATDLFSVIRTGVPTLSQLTLDFHTFIKQYFTQLKQKFVKDMVFIYAKNIIEFLDGLKQSQRKIEKQEAITSSPKSPKSPKQEQQYESKIDPSMIKNLHSSYKLSIDNFINHANNIIQVRQNQFAIYAQGEDLLVGLLKEVEQNLLDLMGTFYVEVSKYGGDTESFENIKEIRSKLEAGKMKRKSQNR